MIPCVSISLPVRRPLLTVWTVCTMLDCDSADVVRKVESGILPFAWDLRLRGSTKSHLRILARSLAEIQTHGRATASDDLNGVIESILPHRRDVIRGPELARMFSCDLCHVTKLINTRTIAGCGREKHGTHSRLVKRECVIRFLTERRVL